MRTPRLSPSVLAALLLAGSLALACKSEEETPPPPPCELAQLGESCAAPASCCSNNCQNDICVAALCSPLAVACAHPSDCCSGACNSVECVDPNSCSDVGVACDDPLDCCTGKCEAGVCTEDICLPLGLDCTSGGQCCTGTCTNLKCAEPTTTTCGDPGDACTSDSPCCSAACNATGHCSNAGGVCGYPGEQCATDSDCCSQNCPNAGTPGATCSSTTCRQATQSCADDSQCCSGLCGFGNVCDALPPGSTGATCKTLGEACALPADCCSTNCQGGACKPAATCNATGDICVRTEDCCSGLCAQAAPGEPGRCDDASGGCGLDGYPCTADSNCCTKQCADTGAGAKVCKKSSGCRMTGNYCDSTASCCGGTNPDDPLLANTYGVFCDGPGTHPGATEWDTRTQDDRTCTGGQSCNPPGNICGYKASQNCCHEGTGSGSQVCRFDANGIQRCFGGPADPETCVETPGNPCCTRGWDGEDPDCCIQVGNVCQFSDQCCGNAPCVPDSSGILRCGTGECLPQGAICSVGGPPPTDPCCAGTTCRDVPEVGWACSTAIGACAQAHQACSGSNPCCFGPCVGGTCGDVCADLGGTCSTDGQCCSAMCDGTHCVACMPEAGSCTDNADCCDGLSCDIAAGATSGTCSSGGTSTCALTDDSCLIDPCCNPTDSCTAGVCTPPAPPCAENGQYCTSGGGQCCNPLQCYTVDAFEQRQSCGPTSTNCFCDTVTECVAMDSPCSTLVTCCGGYCQQNGSTAACTSTDPAQCACKPVG